MDGNIDPIRDVNIINLELILADLEQIDKRLLRLKNKFDKNANPNELTALKKLSVELNNGISARFVELNDEEEKCVKGFELLSKKPVIYAANVMDIDLAKGNDLVNKVKQFAKEEEELISTSTSNSRVVVVSAQVESELSGLDDLERLEYLKELGVEDQQSVGFTSLVNAAYSSLGLGTFFTAGPQEIHSWTMRKGMLAPETAGIIHTDFEKGFIRAEVIGYDDLINAGSEKIGKEKGLMRLEGKEYIVQEGDVVHFRFAN